MYRPTNPLPVAVAFALWAGAANADQFTDDVVAKFQELGFDYIEVKEGISQVKVEAVQGNRKYEVIYDRATGKILKQENERADADEIGRSGVDIDRRNRDFLDDEGDETDDDENDESDDDENDESDDDENDESDDDENDESDDDEDDESDDNDSDESDDSESDESDDED